MKKIAFTLAEVLIVLGIIGIIADMTIPNLKRDIDKIVYVTQLKKFYSTFQQGMNMMMVREGVNSIDETGLLEPARQDELIKRTFNVTRTCKGSDTSCKIKKYKYIDKTNFNDWFDAGYNFITADGMTINLSLNSSCEIGGTATFYWCGVVTVDINGEKKPNIAGRDFFQFGLEKSGSIFSWGSKKYSDLGLGNYWRDDTTSCGREGNSLIIAGTRGSGCAARIIEEGWRMSY